MKYWLVKSEPGEFGIDDLRSRPDKIEHWDGVRNYQARNFMRDEMKTGDQVFFYHSNCETPGIVGITKVVREGYPDHTAFDKNDKHYDPKSSRDNPCWYMVDLKFEKKFASVLSLAELKQHTKLKNMRLLQKGNRLSVMPIEKNDWDYILTLSK